jgi:hypothetical protein
MSRLTDLDPSFVEGNVALAVLLGAMSACATVRAALPAPTPPEHASLRPRNPTEETQVRDGEPVDAFVALLLGTVVLHERLSAIVALASDHGDDPAPVDDAPAFLGGFLR